MGTWVSVLLLRICVSDLSLSFIKSSQMLPYPTITEMAVAYDTITNDILLFGGNSHPQQFTLLRNNVIFDGGETFLNYAVSGASQYFAQIDNQLWILRPDGRFLIIDTETYKFIDPDIYNTATGGCLAVIPNYLFIIGGASSTNRVQIYSLEHQEWVSNIPYMIMGRSSLSCVVVDNTLYAIGGQGSTSKLQTIEVLDISSIDDISTKTWEYFRGYLSTARAATRTVVRGTDIYVIGSDANDIDINIIDTRTEECSVLADLSYGVTSAAPIILGNALHVFGYGTIWLSYYSLETYHYQYALFNTSEPIQPSLPPSALSSTIEPTYAAQTSSRIEDVGVTEHGENETVIIVVLCVFIFIVFFVFAFFAGKREFQKAMKSAGIRISMMATSTPKESRGNIGSDFDGADSGETIPIQSNIKDVQPGADKMDKIEEKKQADVNERLVGAAALKSMHVVQSSKHMAMNRKTLQQAMRVQHWMDNVAELPQYFDNLMENGYDTLAIIKEITDETELSEIGVENILHQRKLFKAVQTLKRRDKNVSISVEGKYKNITGK